MDCGCINEAFEKFVGGDMLKAGVRGDMLGVDGIEQIEDSALLDISLHVNSVMVCFDEFKSSSGELLTERACDIEVAVE